MITFSKVSKSFQGVSALTDLNLDMPKGKSTVLLGTSGCGKSTILRLIAGLLTPDSGTIDFEGQPIGPKAIDAIRRRIGYVIQDGGLFPHLTARQNVALMADHIGWAPAVQTERVDELARLAQIEVSLLSKYPSQLSGGQRQRVGLMRALMLEPELLLLDEPLGALDPITRSDLQHDLKKIFSAVDKTIVLVTHDLGEAFFLGDYIVLLHAGRVVQAGVMDDFVERPANEFVTKFINAQRPPAFVLGAR